MKVRKRIFSPGGLALLTFVVSLPAVCALAWVLVPDRPEPINPTRAQSSASLSAGLADADRRLTIAGWGIAAGGVVSAGVGLLAWSLQRRHGRAAASATAC